MDKQNLMPIAAQPVNRITTGQPLPLELAELSEEALSLDEMIGASWGVMVVFFGRRRRGIGSHSLCSLNFPQSGVYSLLGA